MVLGLGDLMNISENGLMDLKVYIHGGNGFGKKNLERKMLPQFCVEKELCIANTWFKKNEERKITYRS